MRDSQSNDTYDNEHNKTNQSPQKFELVIRDKQ